MRWVLQKEPSKAIGEGEPSMPRYGVKSASRKYTGTSPPLMPVVE
jgi:hypothetical protein